MNMGDTLPLSPSAHKSFPSFRQRYSSQHLPSLGHLFNHFWCHAFPYLPTHYAEGLCPGIPVHVPSSISGDTFLKVALKQPCWSGLAQLLRALGDFGRGEGSPMSPDPDPTALTRTLYWETEMLLGWTVSRTHCFISEANLRGSLDLSQRSFRVHLEGTDQ